MLAYESTLRMVIEVGPVVALVRCLSGFTKTEAGKGCVISDQLDPGLELDGGPVVATGKIFDGLHQPFSNTLSLKSRLDRELSNIEVVCALQDEDATDDLALLQRQECCLLHRFSPEIFDGEPMGRGRRVNNPVHESEGAQDKCQDLVPTVEIGRKLHDGNVGRQAHRLIRL